jgi:hypothetical protein
MQGRSLCVNREGYIRSMGTPIASEYHGHPYALHVCPPTSHHAKVDAWCSKSITSRRRCRQRIVIRSAQKQDFDIIPKLTSSRALRSSNKISQVIEISSAISMTRQTTAAIATTDFPITLNEISGIADHVSTRLQLFGGEGATMPRPKKTQMWKCSGMGTNRFATNAAAGSIAERAAATRCTSCSRRWLQR